MSLKLRSNPREQLVQTYPQLLAILFNMNDNLKRIDYLYFIMLRELLKELDENEDSDA